MINSNHPIGVQNKKANPDIITPAIDTINAPEMNTTPAINSDIVCFIPFRKSLMCLNM